MNMLYLKHLMVGTPLQALGEQVRWAAGTFKRRQHPELADVYLEDKRAHQIMAKLIRTDSNCIDIGSHIGSVLAELHKFAPKGRHFAVEPVPTKAQWLTRKFPKAKVFQLALSDSEGEVTFSQNITRPGFSGLVKAEQRPDDQWQEYQVRCARLDQIIPDDVKIDFIKIDVEGAEALALKGGSSLITKYRPCIIFESAVDAASAFGITHRDLFELLTEQFGYDIYFFKDYLAGDGPSDWERFDKAHVYPFTAFNFLAVPKQNVSSSNQGETFNAAQASDEIAVKAG